MDKAEERYAVVHSRETGKSWRTTAREFSRFLKGYHKEKVKEDSSYEILKDSIKKNFEFSSLDNGAPMHFVDRQRILGRGRKVKPYFAVHSGFAPEKEHIYKRDKRAMDKKSAKRKRRRTENEMLKEAIENGKKVLLGINVAATPGEYFNYRDMQSQHGSTFEDWVSENRGEGKERNYITISANSADEVIGKLKKIYNFCAADKDDFKNRVSVLYKGGVLPYSSFYMGKRREAFISLYDDLVELKQGVLTKGEEYVMGFVHLMHYKVDATVLAALKAADEETALGGNTEQSGDDMYHSILTFKQDNAKETQSYKDMIEIIIRDGGIFVLAAPYVSMQKQAATGEGKFWYNLFWNISKIQEQTSRLPKERRISSAKQETVPLPAESDIPPPQPEA